MKKAVLILFLFNIAACNNPAKLRLPAPASATGRLTGSAFYKTVIKESWRVRDSVTVSEILKGNSPHFLKKFKAVHSAYTDSLGMKHKAVFWVSPDYLSIGTDADWARVPLTPMAAQQVADSLGCFLPTAKMVDLIYQQARIKLEPVPMFAHRDSSITMWQHHLIIEGQRKGRKGLIAGIKKDVVLSEKITAAVKKDRVAIYGWHKPDGNPIQPLYTGHVNWYVDYSHGIRLIKRRMKVDGKLMDYTDVLNDPLLCKLICDEFSCDFYRYAY